MKLKHTVTKDDTGPTMKGVLVGLLENTPDWLDQYRRKVRAVAVQYLLPNTRKIRIIKTSDRSHM